MPEGAPSSSEERIAATARATRGFLYATSTMGVTGARDTVASAAPAVGYASMHAEQQEKLLQDAFTV